MKIISKFHDHYDSASAFYDDSILLKRQSEVIEQSDLKITLPYKTIQVAASYGRSVVDSMNRIAAIDFLYFCGKVYPLFSIFNSSYHFKKVGNGSVRLENRSDAAYFSSIQELINEAEKRDIRFGSGKYAEDKIKKYEQLVKDCLSVEIKADIFSEVGVPYFMTEGYSIITYPVLKNLTKSFKLDAYGIYQEIEMYMGGVLGSQEKETIEISDKDKRDSKGFDNYSFKKRKAS